MVLHNEGKRSCDARLTTGTKVWELDAIPRQPVELGHRLRHCTHSLLPWRQQRTEWVIRPEVLHKTFDDFVASNSKGRPFVRKEGRALHWQAVLFAVASACTTSTPPVLQYIGVDLEIEADSRVSYTDGKPAPSLIAAGGLHDSTARRVPGA